jgi:hypothetical protein
MKTDRARSTLSRLCLVLTLMGSVVPNAGAGPDTLGFGNNPSQGGVVSSGNDGVGGIERSLDAKLPGPVIFNPNKNYPTGWLPVPPNPPASTLDAGNWVNLEHGLAGSHGKQPGLRFLRHEDTADLGALWITNGPANGTAWLVMGLEPLMLPYFGGVLVPTPDLVLEVTLDGNGNALVPMVPDPLSENPFIMLGQAWFPDAGNEGGLCATNGIGMLSL